MSIKLPWYKKPAFCLVGWHTFTYFPKTIQSFPMRKCQYCLLQQEGTYDMCYGGTIWTTIEEPTK